MQILSVNIRNIHASDRDPAVSRLKIIQTVQKVHECGFSRSGAAQDAESRTGGNGQGEVPYDGAGCIFIRKRYILKCNIPVHRRPLRILPVRLRLGIHNVSETLDGNACLAHLRNDTAKLPDRPDQHHIIRSHRDKIADRQRPVNAGDGSEQDNEQNLQARQNVRDGPEHG